ncbi:MAG: cytochrome c oxidase subunit, partial [Microbacterium sp.]|nr:cytochrome c oxidase subunit [Microbacterium sp.]
MRTNTTLWWILVGFFIFIDVLYIGWSVLANPNIQPWYNAVEWVGSIG